MQELFQIAFHPLNMVYSVLLALVLLYWISVIFGALDMGSFDFDVDADVDADIAISGWFTGAMHFFHFDRLPFMLIMSLVIMSAWCLSILSNHYWGDYAISFALAMTGPIVLTSFIIAKLLSYPLIPFFEATNTAVKPVEYVGLVCKVKLPPSGDKFGQGGVDHDGDQLLVNIKLASTADIDALQVGDETLIIGKTDDQRYWLVKPLEPDEYV